MHGPMPRFERSYVRDSIGEYYRASKGGYQEFRPVTFVFTWRFPKIRVPSWGPKTKDNNNFGSLLGSPYFEEPRP